MSWSNYFAFTELMWNFFTTKYQGPINLHKFSILTIFKKWNFHDLAVNEFFWRLLSLRNPPFLDSSGHYFSSAVIQGGFNHWCNHFCLQFFVWFYSSFRHVEVVWWGLLSLPAFSSFLHQCFRSSLLCRFHLFSYCVDFLLLFFLPFLHLPLYYNLLLVHFIQFPLISDIFFSNSYSLWATFDLLEACYGKPMEQCVIKRHVVVSWLLNIECSSTKWATNPLWGSSRFWPLSSPHNGQSSFALKEECEHICIFRVRFVDETRSESYSHIFITDDEAR